jgi:hypothetical protein
MKLDDYRVVKRPEPKFDGAWGLWSGKNDRWLNLTFPSEQAAREALDYLRRHGTGEDHR